MGRLISLTGTSCAGKSTIMRHLLERHDHLYAVESHTTRPPRPGDLLGEYTYVSDEMFDDLEHSGRFLWSVRYGSYRYGTTQKALLAALQDECRVGIMILVPEVLAKLNEFVTRHRRDHDPADSWVACFVVAPPSEVLEQRLMPEELERHRSRNDDENKWLHIAYTCGHHIKLIHNSGHIEQTLLTMGQFLYPRRAA